MDRSDRKNAVGVAFSGGGLQGIAHIGAVRALHELGIRPQYVSGTSSGSAMAALVAMGCNADEMTAFAERYWEVLADFRPIPIVTQLASLKFNKKTEKDGLKDGAVISNVIKEAMDSKGIKGFEDLPINLCICTNDTHTMDECIFTTEKEDIKREHIHYIHGAPLELAVRASMTFPGIYTTCDYKQYNFIDGGSKERNRARRHDEGRLARARPLFYRQNARVDEKSGLLRPDKKQQDRDFFNGKLRPHHQGGLRLRYEEQGRASAGIRQLIIARINSKKQPGQKSAAVKKHHTQIKTAKGNPVSFR